MIFIISLLILPFVFHPDPAPNVRRSRESARRLECEPLSAEAASARRPGQVKVSPPRGDYVERDAVICTERLLAPGLRGPRDEAILNELDAITAELASAAAARRPDLQEHTWLVEAYYPSANVSAKLSFATKNALMKQGMTVSDRTPSLSAADIDVITHLPPTQAYPAACLRYATTGGLREGDALLAVVSRDPRETLLHAGLCVEGAWSWLL